MAEINWIATTAKNFNDTTAWQGGIVPGTNDTAVFPAAGTGNCTLTAAISIGGFKFNAYSGTFSSGGFNIECKGFIMVLPQDCGLNVLFFDGLLT